jgi:hypothetical protein
MKQNDYPELAYGSSGYQNLLSFDITVVILSYMSRLQ